MNKRQSKEGGPSPHIMNDKSERHDEDDNDRLLLSSPPRYGDDNKLYERTSQLQQLLEAFQRSLDTNVTQKELTLITGPSGSGKTALARTLEAHVVVAADDDDDDDDGVVVVEQPQKQNMMGYFLYGKFDQLQQPKPYAALAEALSNFAHIVLARGDDDTERVRMAIRDTSTFLTSDGQALLVEMAPALGEVLRIRAGESSSRVNLRGTQVQKRLFDVIRKFVRAICSPKHPVVILVDDLQWADVVSLDLIKALVAETGTTKGLMLLGTCRSNEVSLADPLSVMLRSLEHEGVLLSNIPVSTLSNEAICYMISDILHLSFEDCAPLAEVVSDHTDGNAFFSVLFVRMLVEGQYLQVASGELTLDKERVRAATETCDIMHLLVEKMKKLPHEVQEVLKTAACIGIEFDEKVLLDVGSVVSSQVLPAIGMAEDCGFVMFEYDSGRGRFLHDRYQQAAYSLTPELDRAAFHLFVGRQLRNKMMQNGAPESLSSKDVFLIVNQMRYAVDLLEDQNEKDGFALLCLRAGERAMTSAAFSLAADYLSQGIGLLSERHWRDQYQLSLDLFNTAAEVAYCNGNFDTVDVLLGAIFSNALSFDDMLWAHSTKIYSLGARNEAAKAIDEGLVVLEKLGERIPAHPSFLRTVWELLKTQRVLRGKSDDDIVNLPPLRDNQKLASMRIMNLLMIYTFWSRQDLMPVVSMRMIQITMKHGLLGMGSSVFGAYAAILTFLNKIDEAYRYGNLALRLLDKFRASEWVPRTHVTVYSTVNPWVEPMRKSIEPLLRAHRIGLVSGDIEFALLNASLYSEFCLYCGHPPLSQLVQEASSFRELTESYGQDIVNSFVTPMVQYGLNLLGCSSIHPCVLTGKAMTEEIALDRAQQQKNGAAYAWILTLKFLLAAYLHEYELAQDLSVRLAKAETETLLPISLRIHYFYEGVVFASLARRRQARSSQKARLARRNLRRLEAYSKHSPENFGNKVQLLKAELAMVHGNYDGALVYFRRSMELAHKQGFTHEEAWACERAGLVLLRECGKPEAASDFLSQARALYEKWGARIKVSQVDRVMAQI